MISQRKLYNLQTQQQLKALEVKEQLPTMTLWFNSKDLSNFQGISVHSWNI